MVIIKKIVEDAKRKVPFQRFGQELLGFVL